MNKDELLARRADLRRQIHEIDKEIDEKEWEGYQEWSHSPIASVEVIASILLFVAAVILVIHVGHRLGWLPLP